jgi:cell division protein FtsB
MTFEELKEFFSAEQKINNRLRYELRNLQKKAADMETVEVRERALAAENARLRAEISALRTEARCWEPKQ